LSCTPASEKRRALGLAFSGKSSSAPDGKASPAAGWIDSAPGRSRPRTQSRKNSRC
jgi:hypothetical protein